MQKLKRVVIKEELVALTGDFISAIVLGQFLYWSDRVRDFDKLLLEEKSIAEKDGKVINLEPKNGWIYKKCDELIEETMLGVTRQSMRNYISKLIGQGYLLERNNPKYKWDRTKQYRVNFQKIKDDLKEKGYTLDGYKITGGLSCESPVSPDKSEFIEDNIAMLNNLPSTKNNLPSTKNNLLSTPNNLTNIPEIISNTTSNTTINYPQWEKEKEEEKKENKKENKKEERKRIEHTKVHQYFVQNIPNEEIRSKVFTIMKHRSETERPITMTFAKVFLKNLEEFSCGIEAQKINILNMSIERGYTTIYNPKYLNYSNQNKYDNQDQATPSYDLNYEEEFASSDAYNDYLQQEIQKLNYPNKKKEIF